MSMKMSMKDLSEEIVIQKIENNEPFFLFVYTTMCGTCSVSKRMIEIALEIVTDKEVVMCNANFMRKLPELLEIQSVPCVVQFENGKMKEKHYALKNVPNIISLLSK